MTVVGLVVWWLARSAAMQATKVENPGWGGHDGQSKPWSHQAKGVKIGTSPMWEDMRSPTV